jgi:hydrogenase nickel incorporation protein HypA/HybF
MHERALMLDLVAELERVARAESARRVTRVDVRLGALSHFTPGHFREHFEDAARDTVAEGAEVHAEVDADVHGPRAAGVVLERVEVES